MTAIMSTPLEVNATTGIDISYLTVGEQKILIDTMKQLKNDNSGTQTIKNSIGKKDSLFKILAAAGKRRNFSLAKTEMPLCFEFYVSYLENLGMLIPNYEKLSRKFVELSKNDFTLYINAIDNEIKLRKLTLEGKVVTQKNKQIIEQVVQVCEQLIDPVCEEVVINSSSRKEREEETSPRTKSINDEIIKDIMSYVNYDSDKLSYSFILEIVQLFQNDSIVCKSIRNGLKKGYLYSTIFAQVEKRGSFKGKVQLLKIKYKVLFDDQKAQFLKKVLLSNEVAVAKTLSDRNTSIPIKKPVIIGIDSNSTLLMREVVKTESNIVNAIKGSIFDILQDAEELTSASAASYTKHQFMVIIALLTKRKKYFFKAQAIKILELIDKLEIKNEIGQDFLDCLDCFAFYKKNLDEMQGDQCI